MAAIASINAGQVGGFLATPATLTASDTISISPGKKQLALFRNGTGGALTALIDGDGGATVDGSVLGLGVVTVSAGYSIALAAGESRAVVLGTISAYTKGVVTITGASGASLQVFDL
jgi:hypothetical protein